MLAGEVLLLVHKLLLSLLDPLLEESYFLLREALQRLSIDLSSNSIVLLLQGLLQLSLDRGHLFTMLFSKLLTLLLGMFEVLSQL